MASTGEAWRLGRRPALDGLRAVAVSGVLLAHVGIPFIDGGPTGVIMFFTLSGFLITSLLLEERQVDGAFSVSAFYIRRARRLMPALFVMVALAVGVEVYLRTLHDWSLVTGSLSYTANFVMIDNQFPNPTALGHTWSLAIEEQFYLTWPLLLMITARLSRLRMLLILTYGSLAAVALRAIVWDGTESGWARAYFGPDTRADSLLIGCALAFMLHGSVKRQIGRWWAVLGVALILLSTANSLSWPAKTEFIVVVIFPLGIALGTACVIYAAVNGRFGLLELPPLVWVGQRSYGIYLYQAPILVLVGHTLGDAAKVDALVAVPSIVLTAALSKRFVEQPFLRSRRSGGSVPGGEPAVGEGGSVPGHLVDHAGEGVGAVVGH